MEDSQSMPMKTIIIRTKRITSQAAEAGPIALQMSAPSPHLIFPEVRISFYPIFKKFR